MNKNCRQNLLLLYLIVFTQFLNTCIARTCTFITIIIFRKENMLPSQILQHFSKILTVIANYVPQISWCFSFLISFFSLIMLGFIKWFSKNFVILLTPLICDDIFTKQQLGSREVRVNFIFFLSWYKQICTANTNLFAIV